MSAIKGAGGGGEKKQQPPVESPDSLQSFARARIVDLLAEGEIAGFAGPTVLRSIYLDETPIENIDGSLNFTDVQVDTRVGTQHQEHIPGFPSVESEVSVGFEIKTATPYIRNVSNPQLDALVVRLAVPALSQTNSENGNTTGYSVGYAIDLATDGGSYVNVITSAIAGKASNTYERSHRIDLPAGSAWIIRVRRTTAESASALIQDKIYVSAITDVIDGKFRYPNSALVGIAVNAEQFPSVPTRSYYIKGRILQVPSNYDPVARTYAGIWDGTFKPAWTSNPAWVYYDLLTNDRFGLGTLTADLAIDKWALYAIARYCDELVPDGRGGTEPRFTCGIYLQTRQDAYKVLQDVASAFRAMSYWGAGRITATADMPADPVYVYTNANVIDGVFSYSGTARRARHNVCMVTWNNHEDFGRPTIEPVEDGEGIAKYGINQTDVVAFGCMSQAQARRFGKWLLLSENINDQSVTFGVGLEGTICLPGQIIEVADELKAGKRMGGRILDATATTATLDNPGDIKGGDVLVTISGDGVSQSRTVSSVAGAVVTLSSAFASVPVEDSVFAVRGAIVPQLFRVISVTNGDEETFTISAIAHNASLFAAVDEGDPITIPATSVRVPRIAPGGVNVVLSEVVGQAATTRVVTVSWDAVPGAIGYIVEWRVDSGQWHTLPRIAGLSVDIAGVLPGELQTRVTAVFADGGTSQPSAPEIKPVPDTTTPPKAVTQGDAATLASAIADAQARVAAAQTTIQAQIDALNAQISDITGSPEWDIGNAYNEGDIVKDSGNLYRALQAVPAGTAITNTAYWELIGNYSSIGEAIAAALSIANATASDLAVEASRIDALVARMPGGSGTLATASALAAITARLDNTGDGKSIEGVASDLKALTLTINDPTTGLSATRATLGTVKARIDNTGAGKSIEAVASDVVTMAATINDGTTGLAATRTRVSTVEARLNNTGNGKSLETVASDAAAMQVKINDPATGLDSKASSTSVTTLKGRLDNTGAGKSIEMVASDLSALSASVNDGTTGLGATRSRVGTVEARLNNTGSGKSLEAVASDTAALKTQINDPTTGLGTKAGISTTNAITSRLNSVDGAGKTVETLASNVTALSGQIEGKADVSITNALSLRVSAVEGIYGVNLLPNPALSVDAREWLPIAGSWNQAGDPNWILGRDDLGASYQVAGTHNLGMHNTATPAANNNFAVQFGHVLPVEADTAYIFSAWLAAANLGIFDLRLYYYDAAMAYIAEHNTNPLGSGFTGGTNATKWDRLYSASTPPTGATWMRLGMRAFTSGANQPRAHMMKPMVERKADGQTAPSAWNTGPVDAFAMYEQTFDVQGRVSGVRHTNDGQLSDFEVLADVFKIVKPGGGARTEYSDGHWRVYDTNGTLRVRMGVW